MACGDAHVKNFGVYASAERNLIFAVNDYDEVFVAPWEWDLKRLAASAAIAAQCLAGDKSQCEAAARECARSYHERMLRYAEMGYLEVYDRKVLLSRYQLVDFARKVAGIGSIGTRCWICYKAETKTIRSSFKSKKLSNRCSRCVTPTSEFG